MKISTSLFYSHHQKRPVSSEGKRFRALGISLGVVATMIVLIAVMGIWKRNICSPLKCWEGISPTGGPELAAQEEDSILTPTIANPELIFKDNILTETTSNFEAETKLGNGGFGSVFKGVLPNGREVAVKRLYMGPRRANAELLNEANLISRVQHRNLVKLLDCSVEGSRKSLV